MLDMIQQHPHVDRQMSSIKLLHFTCNLPSLWFAWRQARAQSSSPLPSYLHVHELQQFGKLHISYTKSRWG